MPNIQARPSPGKIEKDALLAKSRHGTSEAEKPKMKVFERRHDTIIIISQLRMTVRNLEAEVERLTERNKYLEENMIVREQQLAVAEGKLALQKAAWEEVKRQTPTPSLSTEVPRLMLQDISQSRSPAVRPLSARASIGSTPPIPEEQDGIEAKTQAARGGAVRPLSARPVPVRPMSGKPPARRPLSARENNNESALPASPIRSCSSPLDLRLPPSDRGHSTDTSATPASRPPIDSRRPLSARERNKHESAIPPWVPSTDSSSSRSARKHHNDESSAFSTHSNVSDAAHRRPTSKPSEPEQAMAMRPVSARNPATTLLTPRTPRPSTARPALGGGVGQKHPHVPTAVSEQPVFSRFQYRPRAPAAVHTFKSFSADVVQNQSAAVAAIRNISEQTASFDSLGVFLACSWAEVCQATQGEPSPNYFRLAVCCSIFDKIVGVVGMYSDILMELRKELYSGIFRGFNSSKVEPWSAEDYTQTLPWFVEFQRLDADRETHKKAVEQLLAAQAALAQARSQS